MGSRIDILAAEIKGTWTAWPETRKKCLRKARPETGRDYGTMR